jgi:hypothetical protein
MGATLPRRRGAKKAKMISKEEAAVAYPNPRTENVAEVSGPPLTTDEVETSMMPMKIHFLIGRNKNSCHLLTY